MSKVTLVTGLWDIKRSELQEGWNRSFEDHYVRKFKQLLEAPCNMIIYGEKSLGEEVFKVRKKENTLFIERGLDWFKSNFFDKIQEIRQDSEWYNQAGWLKDSTQASLEMYNPLVMSKPFLLHDAKIFDKFNSEYMFWIDAGITNTVHPGYFTHDNVLDKLTKYINKINFIAFPYKAEKEIHGFSYPAINRFAGDTVDLVGRGGFFGGPVHLLSEFNSTYYSIFSNTINQGYMGTEESLFSIMIHRYPELISFSRIESNGLIGKFFEDLKNDTLKVESKSIKKGDTPVDPSKVGVYVMTYNSPAQFEKLCKSFEIYDRDYLDLPQKFLLNNSLDETTAESYKELCEKYGFTEIKKDNLGICGGRQFIAEHFDKQSDLEYYLFFEDDMFFYVGDRDKCKNGFLRKDSEMYKKSLQICHKEGFDFLKLNFTEFFGDNQKQWAWHNVPAETRKRLFPERPTKDSSDVNLAPFCNYRHIKSYRGIPYATGEVYYCNWPQIVSREGNTKMFLETTWTYPYEQTWMSHFYQLTIEDKLKPGILLMTPTEHDRFEHYPRDERREN